MKIKLLFALIVIPALLAVPVRVLVIRGYDSYDRAVVSRLSYERAVEAVSEIDGIDIILFPEFAFGGRDGTALGHPYIRLVWEDDSLGFVPYPGDSTRTDDLLCAAYMDSLRQIAISETCYIWASSCGENIAGTNYNSTPILPRTGKSTGYAGNACIRPMSRRGIRPFIATLSRQNPAALFGL